jgi:hypothetical protein
MNLFLRSTQLVRTVHFAILNTIKNVLHLSRVLFVLLIIIVNARCHMNGICKRKNVTNALMAMWQMEIYVVSIFFRKILAKSCFIIISQIEGLNGASCISPLVCSSQIDNFKCVNSICQCIEPWTWDYASMKCVCDTNPLYRLNSNGECGNRNYITIFERLSSL